MTLSPLTLSLPHAYNWPLMLVVQNEDVDPHAICTSGNMCTCSGITP